MTLRWVLNPTILLRSGWSKPLMTLMTMISTATPSVTPSTEIRVITETKVLLGRRYRSASSSSNGNRDMRAKLIGPRGRVNVSRSHQVMPGASWRHRHGIGARPLGCRNVKLEQSVETRWRRRVIPCFCSLKAALLCPPWLRLALPHLHWPLGHGDMSLGRCAGCLHEGSRHWRRAEARFEFAGF